MSRRIIIERDDSGHWSAWFADEPQTTFGGDTMLTALQRLGTVLRESENRRLRPVTGPDELVAGRAELELPEPCPDCHGSGVYVGLSMAEPCERCGGAG